MAIADTEPTCPVGQGVHLLVPPREPKFVEKFPGVLTPRGRWDPPPEPVTADIRVEGAAQ